MSNGSFTFSSSPVRENPHTGKQSLGQLQELDTEIEAALVEGADSLLPLALEFGEEDSEVDGL